MPKRSLVSLILLVILVIAVGLREPRFLQVTSIESVLLWLPLILVVALGQLLVILTGGIDISVGSILGFSGITIGLILKASPELPTALVFGLGCLIGLALGFVNAVLVVWVRISPLVVTIATLAAYRGLTFIVSKGDQIDSSMIPDRLTRLAHQGLTMGPLTFSGLLIISIALAGAFAAFLKLSPYGRDIFAFGSNTEAARLRGIPLKRVQILVFSACGACSGLAGVMYACRFGFINPGSAGQNFELTVIAAVAIGGAKLTGGSGSVFGTFLGCLLLAAINVALSVLGIDANWQVLAYGVVILAAVTIDGLVSRRSA